MLRLLLVGPVPPPYGGMALQARQLEQLLTSEGHTVRLMASNFPCPAWIERIPVVRTLYRLAAIWPRLWNASREVDVIHILAASWFYFFAVVYPTVLVGRLRGKRVVMNYRGGEAAAFFGAFGFLARPAMSLPHCISAPSRFLAGIIGSRFSLPVVIVPNILNRARFPFRERTAFGPRLLVTRHLEEIYDIPSVLRAFGKVQSRYADASLTIAGGGNQRHALEQLVSTAGLRNVRFTGAVEHQKLAALYADCDIYVNASRVDNFPGALLEASSVGLPVVSTNAGGIPHIYTHEVNALLVKVGDWEALADSVIRLIGEPDLAMRLVQGAASIVDGCQWERVRPQLYRSYGLEPVAVAAHEVAAGLQTEG